MPSRYTLWIVSPEDLIWSHVFDEVTLSLQSAFRQLGMEVPIVTNPQQISGTAIILGANLAAKHNIPIPRDAIIFNLEQVHPDSQWFSPGMPYIDMLKRHPVWDFSKKNIDALKGFGIEETVHCPIGYAPELTGIRRTKEDIDVMFVGGGHPRRQKLFEEITAGGMQFQQVYKLFGKERDDYLARGKIHINVHKEPARLFEIARVSYLLANRCFVISETGADTEMEKQFDGGLVFCEYDQMVEKCLHYLVHPKERKTIAEAGFELFKKMSQKEFLAAALEEHERLHIKRAQKSLLSFERPQPEIFIAIASFRDPELQPTVSNVFRKAKYPERIHVGICLQIDPEADQNCRVDLEHRNEQIRITECNWQDSKGANWARSEALKLMNGEPYVLLIDSHMRFESGWDEILMDMLRRCPSQKPILTAYCPNYDPPNKRATEPGMLLRIRVRGIIHRGAARLLYLTGLHVPITESDERMGLYPSPFCIANCLFTRAETLAEVPLDPHIHFWGDELDYAARLWTHGYDTFQFDKVALYHYWVRADQFALHHYREHTSPENLRSIQRINHLLGFEEAKDAKSLVEIERYGLGNKRTLKDLWSFAGIDWEHETVTADAEEGKWNMQAHKPSASFAIGKSTGEQPKIFVNIACYRDPECQWTVKDLFEKATYPDRINVGICWQFDPNEDKHCFEIITRPEQVRIMPVDWREAEGVCWARYHTQQLWEGEEYTLMTDSHMRFVPGWDELMIAELARCDSDKPLLSSSPASYEPPNKLSPMMRPTFRRVKPFTPTGNMRCQAEAFDRFPPKPLRGAFVVCNNIFSRSSITTDVPYDPYLYFDQEEITYSARLYTHGWDVFSASRQFLYHYYNTKESVRPLHWTDLRKKQEARIRFFYDRGLRRFNHLTRHRTTDDPEIIRDIDKYGFGTMRSLEQFEEYTGIDFKRKTTSDKALRGLFVEDLAKYRDRPVRVPEIDDKIVAGSQLPVASKLMSNAQHATRNSLEPGDFMPFFYAMDTNDADRAIELYGGKHVMLTFLPTNNFDALKTFFTELNRQTAQAKPEAWQIFVLNDTVANLKLLRERLGITHLLWADPGSKIAQSLGLCRAGEATQPVAFVLNTNLQIMHVHAGKDPANLAAALVQDCNAEQQKHREKNASPVVLSELPPALIVPNVLSPELCRKCIESFHSGHTFQGTVGASKATGYRPDTKKRVDHIAHGKLLEELDDKLSRSFFPEIRKIFGCEITHRELYKIGLYTGEQKGFFKQHRDNFDEPLGYRRIASTIHLSDDYEGGGLRFPEYGSNIYRPTLGSGIAFSCSTLHEALPVTKGERFVLVGFFHGEQDEAYRRHYATRNKDALKIKDFTPTLRKHPDIKKSRDFYEEWREKNVKINWEGENK